MIYYSLPDSLGDDTPVELSVYAAGDEDAIWTWSRKPADGDKASSKASGAADTRVLAAEPGLNRHVWDLHYPGMERFDGLILWSDMKEGPRAVPGDYRAQLRVGDEVQEASFSVVQDPRSSASAEDMAAQFAFVSETRDLLSRTHTEIGKVRTLRSKLDSLKARLVDAGDSVDQPSPLLAEILSIGETITDVEETLYQTRNQSRQDPLNFPIRLNDKLASLMRMVALGDQGPTTQAQAVKAELSSAIEAQLAILDTVWKEQIPSLNARIKSADIDMISMDAD